MRHSKRVLREKRGAIELGMNTIVIVVIGVVLLTLGLRWIYGVFGGLEERSQEIDEQLKKQISDLFEGGDETLIIRPNSVTIKQKESKDIIFAVRNTISDGKGHKFSYRTVLTNPEGKDASEVMSWLTGASENEITIPSGKIEYRAVAVDIPGTAPIGTYRFEVTLDADNNEGDSKANFIIRVRGE